MVVHLAGVLVYTIMLIGQWSPNTFLKYIHCQVLEFSKRVVARMITNEQFFMVPDFVHHVVDGDTRTRNNNSLAMTSTFNGMHENSILFGTLIV